jgi:hypothetical protein
MAATTAAGKNQHPEQAPIVGTSHLFHRHEQFNSNTFFIISLSCFINTCRICAQAKIANEINDTTN